MLVRININMSFIITRTVAPSFAALTNDEIEQWLRLDEDTDALTVAMLLASATEWVEGYTGQTIATSTFEITFNEFACEYRLPLYPMQSLEGVDAFGPVAATYWGGTRSVWLTDNPPIPPTITVIAGYTSPEAVPVSIKQAIAVLINDGYDNRVGISDAAMAGVSRLLASQRRITL